MTAPLERSTPARDGQSSVSQPPPPPSIPLEQHHCPASTCSILQVFETTELLELILNHLNTKDVLSLRRTSTHWDSTINHSPYLRLHSFAIPHWRRPGINYELLPLTLPGLRISPGQGIDKGQWIIASFTADTIRVILKTPPPPKALVRSNSIYEGLRAGGGSRAKAAIATAAWQSSRSSEPFSQPSSPIPYRDLLITQPPLLGMQAFTIYADDAPSATAATSIDDENAVADLDFAAKCANYTGITLGFLAGIAQSLLAGETGEEDGRPFARPSSSTSPSRRPVKVVFKAIMSFCEPVRQGPVRPKQPWEQGSSVTRFSEGE